MSDLGGLAACSSWCVILDDVGTYKHNPYRQTDIHTYITLHNITLHYITLHCITLHYITYIHTYILYTHTYFIIFHLHYTVYYTDWSRAEGRAPTEGNYKHYHWVDFQVLWNCTSSDQNTLGLILWACWYEAAQNPTCLESLLNCSPYVLWIDNTPLDFQVKPYLP